MAAPSVPSFNADIRPILTKHCTACHGGVKAAGKISFVYKEKALGLGKSGKAAVVPGKPEASELIARVLSTDPDTVMPKPDHGPALNPGEIAKLTAWIAAGAPWDEHWSFMPPKDHPLPPVTDKNWPKVALDHFVLARLERESLAPSAAADAAEWLRRATLDLTGLPPTWEEWTGFETDWKQSADQAKNAAVDRLLASPHYGERWAALWLDLARYADTQGFEKDLGRTVWPYRDWLIRAFNADMPYSDFTVRQLAGDQLESPDLVATAFHRNTWTNTEGGTDDEEYRVAAVTDRVNTTWTTWQSTTFGCTQCHSHPYDPFPHEDYYRFMAFFNSTEDADLDNEYPTIKAANDPAQQQISDRLAIQARQARGAVNDAGLAAVKGVVDWKLLKATEIKPSAATGTLTQTPEGLFLAGGTNPTRSSYVMRFPRQAIGALRLKILPQSDDPKQWLELASVLSQVTLSIIGTDGKPRPVELAEVIADHLTGPFDPQESLQENGDGFGPYPALVRPRWCVIVPKVPAVANEGELLEISLHHKVSCNGSNQPSILRKFTLEATADQKLAQFVASPERAVAWKAWRTMKKEADAIAGTNLPGLLQSADNAGRTTRVFLRGNRMTRDAEVAPGIPVVSRPPQKQNLNRLDMARWLVSPDNTLTARVMANRLWAELFGIGIVETQEDFGSSGAMPTHPELLDHLALRFSVPHQWRIKPLLKELILSAAYGQTNKAAPALLQRDPRNHLLARGPRTRLTAEMVRDQSLTAAGVLSRKQFGPPVFPPQPDGVWRTVYNGAKWEASKGEDRFRRAVYTYWKRTSAYPSFVTFDMPSRDICSPRRLPTNTPLQALVTLNDPAYLEMAQALAKQMAGAAPDVAGRIHFAHRRLHLADASAKTMEVLTSLYQDSLRSLESTPEESKKLAETAEAAALVVLANTMMNTDAALSK